MVLGAYDPVAVKNANDSIHTGGGGGDYGSYIIPAGSSETFLVNGFTGSMWVEPPYSLHGVDAQDPNVGVFQLIMGTGKNNHRFNIHWNDSTNQLHFTRSNNDNSSPVTVSVNMSPATFVGGFHLAFTVQPSGIIGYVNGQNVTNAGVGSTNTWTDGEAQGWNIFLGATNTNGSFHSFEELFIRDLNIWSDIKTNSEVFQIYNSTLNHPSTNRYLTKNANDGYDGLGGSAIIEELFTY